jgi:hypothetical protein
MPLIEAVRNVPVIKDMMPISEHSRSLVWGVVRRKFVEGGKSLVDIQESGSQSRNICVRANAVPLRC